MAKIAVKNSSGADRREMNQPRAPEARLLSVGEGWTVNDVVCTAGPRDRAFEEQHSQTSIAVVVSGTFQYRTSTGGELMTPGSILLGNPGDSFACGHEHGVGDRCIAFHYSDEFRAKAEVAPARLHFRVPRIPAISALASLVAKVSMFAEDSSDHARIEEVAYEVFARATSVQNGFTARELESQPSSVARVTRVLRAIEAQPDRPHSLTEMAATARLSPYHFLRCFRQLTGTTPRQYLLRMRLRTAAIRLKQKTTRILDVAFDCGFADVSNFNRAFRSEFGMSPRAYRSV